MIVLEGVSARRRPFSLSGVSASWGPGVHAVLGSPADGATLLLSVLVGAVAANRGTVRVLEEPATRASVRKKASRVPLSVSLPMHLRVEEVFDVARALRGDRDAPSTTARLASMGIEVLARRPVRSLSRGELRSVALAEAVTSPAVQVLAIEEPLVGIDARVLGRVPDALRAKARAGGIVVLTTTSMRDAAELADDFMYLRSGMVVGYSASVPAPVFGPYGGEMTAVTRNDPDARALAAALAREPEVEGFDLGAFRVVLRGRDPVALGRALGHAALEANVDVVELRSAPGAAR